MSKKKKIGLLSEAKLRKKYPTSTKASSLLNMESLRLPSRIIRLNWQMNGGIPYGKILELHGEESTGKSLLAIDFAYCAQQLGGIVVWADAENAFDPTWMVKNGIDLDRVELLEQEIAIEVISDWMLDTVKMARTKLVNNEPILFVLDSLAALTTLDNIGMSHQDKRAEMGKRAGKIYEFWRERNMEFKKYGVCVIAINQLRSKVGASQYEDPDTTPGGKSTKFYAAQRLSVVRGKQIKEKVKGTEIKVGQNAYIGTRKDKTGPPRDRTETTVRFLETKAGGIGFNKYLGLPELLVSTGVLERAKGSSRYYYKGEHLANGEEALLSLLTENNELRAKLVKKSGVNTISKTKAKLETITYNMYPVKLKETDEE